MSHRKLAIRIHHLRFAAVKAVGLLALALALGPQTASAATSIQVVDSFGSTGFDNSLVLDNLGHPVISYHDANALKLAHCNDSNCAGNNESISFVDLQFGQQVGSFTSLALDGSGNPVISYFDIGNGDLKLAHCNDPDCIGGNESIQTVDSTGTVGLLTSMALDTAGNPIIAYDDQTTATLKLAHCNDPNCAGGDETIQILDAGSAADIFDISMVLDAAGNPVIAYFRETLWDLRLVRCNDPNCDGVDDYSVIVDDMGLNLWVSAGVDISGFPVIAYMNSGGSDGPDLKLVHCNDLNCLGGDEIKTTVASVGNVGHFNSMKLDVFGNPVILYQDLSQTNLYLARCHDPYCYTEHIQTVSTGLFGIFSDLVLDANSFPVISYNDITNADLMLAHCDTWACGPITLRVDGDGPGYGFMSDVPNGINCVWEGGIPVFADCANSAPAGTSYTIFTAPTAGSVFFGWEGCDSISTSYSPGDTCHITPTHDTVIVGHWGPPLPPLACDVLLNCSFEKPSGPNLVPTSWKPKHIDLPTDGTDNTTTIHGAQSFRIQGSNKTKVLYQQVNMSRPAGTQVALGFGWRGDQVAATPGSFAVVVTLFGPAGREVFRLDLPSGTNPWTQAILAFIATQDFDIIRVQIVFGGTSGTAWFDAFNLVVN